MVGMLEVGKVKRVVCLSAVHRDPAGNSTALAFGQSLTECFLLNVHVFLKSGGGFGFNFDLFFHLLRAICFVLLSFAVNVQLHHILHPPTLHVAHARRILEAY